MFEKRPLAVAVSSIIAAGALGATAMTVPNKAVAAEDTIEEIVVTGSRLKRPDLEAVSPVSIVDQEEFTLSGVINVEQKLAQLPQTLPSFGPSSNNPGDGTARVNLRGLGTARTLVLVNGRRYIPATQSGVVDLNNIPAPLIERVDVVTGGASAVYGSDAMAGVVNFIMKDDFSGVEVNALYDTTTKGDAEKYDISLTMGGDFADGRGNAVLFLQYSDREALYQGDRSFSDVALTDSTDDNGNPILVPGGSSGIPGTRVFGGPTVTTGPNAPYTLGRFNADGTGAPFADPADRFNYAPDNFLQLPQKRYTAFAMGHFDLTEKARGYMELTYAQNKVPQELAPTPAFLGGLEVNPDSPFFAPSVQDALRGMRADPLDDDENVFLPFIGRRMVENGPRQARNERDSWRALFGVDGDINDQWSYDVFVSRSSTSYSEPLNNDVSDTRFRQAVLVTDDGSACQDPSGGCVPMNIFGPGNISQEAVGFVNIGATNITKVTQDVVGGNVSGTFDNPMSQDAPIAVLFGAEYRKEKSSFRPDTFLSSGDVLGFNAGEATTGSFDVTEFFFEAEIPLVTGVTGAEYLGLWGGYRYSDYSTVGGVNSYAATLTWAPISDLSFRGGYQRATRAPNVIELFLGQANGFPSATDPCAADGAPNLGDAQLVALCEATGVPAGQVGVFSQANTQIEGIFGGNPDLQEETSDTFTLGVVWQPEVVEGLDVTLDYYDIKIEDAISVLGGGVDNVLSICYNDIRDLGSPFCQAISRRPDGNVDVVRVLNENIGELRDRGIDLNVSYSIPLDFGMNGGSTLDISYRSNFLLEREQKPVAELDTVNICDGYFGNTCGSPNPEYQHYMRVTWASGPLTLSMAWQMLDSVRDDSIKNDGVDPNDLAVPKLKAEHYFELAGAYQVTDAFRVNAGITNLFNNKPTPVGDVQEQANTFPSTYDVIGRRFFLSGTYHFQ